MENNKIKAKKLLSMTIVAIGDAFNAESRHQDLANKMRLFKPKTATDGSNYVSHWYLTFNDEPINLTEYACLIANGASIHATLMEDCDDSRPDDFKRD